MCIGSGGRESACQDGDGTERPRPHQKKPRPRGTSCRGDRSWLVPGKKWGGRCVHPSTVRPCARYIVDAWQEKISSAHGGSARVKRLRTQHAWLRSRPAPAPSCWLGLLRSRLKDTNCVSHLHLVLAVRLAGFNASSASDATPARTARWFAMVAPAESPVTNTRPKSAAPVSQASASAAFAEGVRALAEELVPMPSMASPSQEGVHTRPLRRSLYRPWRLAPAEGARAHAEEHVPTSSMASPPSQSMAPAEGVRALTEELVSTSFMASRPCQRFPFFFLPRVDERAQGRTVFGWTHRPPHFVFPSPTHLWFWAWPRQRAAGRARLLAS